MGKNLICFCHFIYISALTSSPALVRYHQHSLTLDKMNLVQSCSYMQFFSFIKKYFQGKRRHIQEQIYTETRANIISKKSSLFPQKILYLIYAKIPQERSLRDELNQEALFNFTIKKIKYSRMCIIQSYI